MAYLNETDCCALSQLISSNNSTLKELKELIKDAEEDGLRALYTITTSKEKTLEKRLINLGFIQLSNFKRRRDYEQKSFLKMWFKNL